MVDQYLTILSTNLNRTPKKAPLFPKKPRPNAYQPFQPKLIEKVMYLYQTLQLNQPKWVIVETVGPKL